MSAGNAIDEKLTTELSGRAKLRALVDALFGGWAGYARHRGIWPDRVKTTVLGQRRGDDVRDMLAADLNIDRAEIDELIDGDQRPAVRSA